MIRPARGAVELLLWLGVVAGLSLLLVWWDVRPGSAVDYQPEHGDAGSLFTASFLLVSSITALVLGLRVEPPLARLAAAVAGLALVLGGGPWSEVEDAEYLGIVLQICGVLLWVLVARSSIWAEPGVRATIHPALAVALTLCLVAAVGYGVLVLAYAEVDQFPAPVVPATALLAWALRVVAADVPRGRRGPDHRE